MRVMLKKIGSKLGPIALVCGLLGCAAGGVTGGNSADSNMRDAFGGGGSLLGLNMSTYSAMLTAASGSPVTTVTVGAGVSTASNSTCQSSGGSAWDSTTLRLALNDIGCLPNITTFTYAPTNAVTYTFTASLNSSGFPTSSAPSAYNTWGEITYFNVTSSVASGTGSVPANASVGVKLAMSWNSSDGTPSLNFFVADPADVIGSTTITASYATVPLSQGTTVVSAPTPTLSSSTSQYTKDANGYVVANLTPAISFTNSGSTTATSYIVLSSTNLPASLYTSGSGTNLLSTTPTYLTSTTVSGTATAWAGVNPNASNVEYYLDSFYTARGLSTDTTPSSSNVGKFITTSSGATISINSSDLFTPASNAANPCGVMSTYALCLFTSGTTKTASTNYGYSSGNYGWYPVTGIGTSTSYSAVDFVNYYVIFVNTYTDGGNSINAYSIYTLKFN